MLILRENKVSKTQLNTKIQKKVSENFDINVNFSMFYGYYIDLRLDFTDEEYTYARESNFSSASLGDNILRVETAAIAAFSYIQIINSSESK